LVTTRKIANKNVGKATLSSRTM